MREYEASLRNEIVQPYGAVAWAMYFSGTSPATISLDLGDRIENEHNNAVQGLIPHDSC